MRYAECLLTTLAIVGLSGCGWERKASFESPSPGTRIEVQQPFPANGWGVRLELKSKGTTKTLYQLRGDVFLNFVDVAWAPDTSSVAVLTCGTPRIRLAYSLGISRDIPFQQMEPVVAASIRRRYRLDEHQSNKDVFDWACSDEGKRRFLKSTLKPCQGELALATPASGRHGGRTGAHSGRCS